MQIYYVGNDFYCSGFSFRVSADFISVCDSQIRKKRVCLVFLSFLYVYELAVNIYYGLGNLRGSEFRFDLNHFYVFYTV